MGASLLAFLFVLPQRHTGTTQYLKLLLKISGAESQHRWDRSKRDRCGRNKKWICTLWETLIGKLFEMFSCLVMVRKVCCVAIQRANNFVTNSANIFCLCHVSISKNEQSFLLLLFILMVCWCVETDLSYKTTVAVFIWVIKLQPNCSTIQMIPL